MDNDLTYKAILHSIIPNKLFDDMSCESCSTKFTLFKRKKQCKDCLRYYCTDCVIRRGDRVLSCDNCSMLSRRPLIKSQVLKMKTKDLKQYLIAKKVSLRGCVEKEDLVNILMQYANNGESIVNNERQEPNINTQQTSNRQNINENNIPPRSENPSAPPTTPTAPTTPTSRIIIEEVIENSETEIPSPEPDETSNHSFMIVELPDDDNDDATINTTTPQPQPPPTSTSTTTTTTATSSASLTSTTSSSSSASATATAEIPTNNDFYPEPMEIEQDNESDNEVLNNNIPDNSDEAKVSTPSVTEIPVLIGNVKLRNIAERSHLDYLNIKQLKDLLRTNRVDYHGCVERSELLDRAGRLWDDHKSSRDTEATFVDSHNDDGLCKICWDSPIECVILECGHMACCIECGKQMNECPICRQYVVRVVRFFKA